MPARPHPQQLPRGGRATVAAAVVVMVPIATGWWVHQHGYVSWFGAACTDVGFDPVPSYDVLVTEHDQSPYCARRLRGEAWF